MTIRTLIGTSFLLALLSGCGPQDVILPGERLNIRDGLPGEQMASVNQARPISLPAPVVNADWTMRNGSPAHRIPQPALGANLTQLFAVNIGEGDSRRFRITGDPVVAGGVIYTIDARARVTATATNGGQVWTRDLAPAGDTGSASGGGLAVGGGRVFVTSGYGELTALDASSGGVLWTQDLNAPGGSAPTVQGDLVYVTARDGQAWAIETGNGRIRWTQGSVPGAPTYGGGAGIALSGDVAIIPFGSGQILGTFAQGGTTRWSSVIAGTRLGSALGTIPDIAADPVVDNGRVYVGNVGGRVVALDPANGDQLWTAREGAAGPLWSAGGSLFFVNDLSQLVRLDAATGEPVWHVDLPKFTQTRARRQKTIVAHYGPILAGGRLILASADGLLRQFDPISGALVAQVAIPGGATTNPVVAGGTLYVVTTRGQLVAFR